MDISPFIETVISQGIWCALFVWLLVSSQKKSESREEKLYDVITEQKNTLKEISNSLILMNERIGKLEDNILGGKGND